MSLQTEPRDGRISQRINQGLLDEATSKIHPFPLSSFLDLVLLALVNDEITFIGNELVVVKEVLVKAHEVHKVKE